jgi:hypothetical protein
MAETVLTRFTEQREWGLAHGLSALWARIEANQLDQSRSQTLSKCAAGSLVKLWRKDDPTGYQSAIVPPTVSIQLDKHLSSNQATTIFQPLSHCDARVKRVEEFVRLLD